MRGHQQDGTHVQHRQTHFLFEKGCRSLQSGDASAVRLASVKFPVADSHIKVRSVATGAAIQARSYSAGGFGVAQARRGPLLGVAG